MGFEVLGFLLTEEFRGKPRTGNGSCNGGMELLKSQSGKPWALSVMLLAYHGNLCTVLVRRIAPVRDSQRRRLGNHRVGFGNLNISRSPRSRELKSADAREVSTLLRSADKHKSSDLLNLPVRIWDAAQVLVVQSFASVEPRPNLKVMTATNTKALLQSST